MNKLENKLLFCKGEMYYFKDKAADMAKKISRDEDLRSLFDAAHTMLPALKEMNGEL